MNEFDEILKSPVSRRAFVQRMGAAGLGVAATSLLGGTLLTGCNGGSSNGQAGPVANTYPANFGSGDIRILNYALTLEILEADLYRQALNVAAGRPIGNALVPIAQARATYGNAAAIGAGGLSGQLAAAGFLYLVQFAYVEAAHRDFLRVAIQANGGTPVAPNPGGYRFPGGNPGSNLKTILQNIVPLEETGVRAYLGAVPDFSNANFLQVAGTIYSTEARHSASLRYILDPNDPGPSRMLNDREVTSRPPSVETFEKLLQVQEVLNIAGGTYFA
ncbi:MAG TPA: ferritin-like domain-containing protein [Abditibacteriaceae bacterium]